MPESKDLKAIEQRIWNAGNRYRGHFESESIITIWSDMIYLHAMKREYASLLEESTDDLHLLLEQLRDLANSDAVQFAVVNDLGENVRHALMPRTNIKNRIKIFNEIREDGISLIREQCDRVTLMKILQQMNIDFGTRMNSRGSTPGRINLLMARIAETIHSDSQQLTVFDPTAGTGGSLIAMRNILDKSINLNLVGQELDEETYIRCSMMLDLADNQTTRHVLTNVDTLNQVGNSDSLKADVVIADPPYSVRWNPSAKLVEKEPYSTVGVLPPKSKADLAFVLSGLSRLSKDGIMVIQLPHGVLFRGAAEAKIRKYLVDQNYIDAIIGLPSNLQYGTSISTMLLVLRKSRKRKDILFIDASNDFEKSRPNNVLPESSMNTIVETYRSFHDVNKYAHVATQNEILDNDFNLNIPRYVDSYTPPEAVSITKLEKQLTSLDYEVETLGVRIKKIMSKYRDE